MNTREEAVQYALTFPDVYRDEPFHDPNWTVIRKKKSRKVFLWIFEKEGHIWLNVRQTRSGEISGERYILRWFRPII